MIFSDQSIQTIINCGRQKHLTTNFNDRSSIDQIHEQVRYLCGSDIPNSYCLLFYNDEIKKFMKLNQNQLEAEVNPFRWSLFIADPTRLVDLYVIDTSNENDTQSGI